MRKNSKQKPARILRQADLAAMFGVSRVTVSCALRNAGGVNPKLAADIVKAARASGYSGETHFHARAMRLLRDNKRPETNVIAVLVGAGTRDLAQSPFHVRFVTGSESAAESSGDEVIVVTQWGPKPDLPRVVARGQVDGFIWMPSEPDMDVASVHASCAVPSVTLFYRVPGADLVAVDDHGALRAMGEYLARKGHRRVAFVGPVLELARARLDGLRAGLAGAGGQVLDDDVRMKRYVMQPDTVLPLVRELLDRRRTLPELERFTAIAAYNDYIAWTVMRCLRDEYGLRVPRDMSVTGFDGLDSSNGASPRLTTAAMPLEELGAEAVRLIDWRMRNPGGKHRRVVLPAPLVEGESVGEVGVQSGRQREQGMRNDPISLSRTLSRTFIERTMVRDKVSQTSVQ
jgi:LacI family transcriptional regulator